MAKTIIAHVMLSELRGFDIMQGGRSVDPVSGLPEYTKLSKMIKMPEVRQFFIENFEYAKRHGKLRREIQELADEIDKEFPASPHHEEMPYKEERIIAHEGIGGDTALAVLPIDLCNFLDALIGAPRTNPKTGLPQYYGPLIAATAAVAGSLWGRRSARRKNSALARAAAEAQARYDRDFAIAEAQRKAPVDALNALAAISSMGHGIGATPEERLIRAGINPKKLEEEERAEELASASPPSGHAFGGEIPRGIDKSRVVDHPTYHHSQLIEGPGKGQDDIIKTLVPTGSYIIDASSVSDLGDGSTEAGAQVIEDYLDEAHAKASGGEVNDPADHDGYSPVMISNGEYLIAPGDVRNIGDGDPKQGAKILRGMVKKLRSDKTRKRKDLPPKAKNLSHYVE